MSIFFKWPPVAILDVQKSLLAISVQYHILFCLKFLTKWLPSAILDVRDSLSITFLAILYQYGICYLFLEFFYKMAAGAHFGCPKFTFDGISGHFRSIRNFFALFFLQNGRRRPFWMSEIHSRSHLWPFQINTQL